MTDSNPGGGSARRDSIAAMRRLEGIVASAMDGIITINAQQEVILFNPAAERMFGLLAERAIGRQISQFVPERHRASHAEHIRRFAETGVTRRQMGSLTDISGLRADGEEFPLEASISQVDVNGERLSTVILRDITERKAAESALLESQRRMQGVVDSAMDALITIDGDQRISLFNPAAERMFGVPAAEALGAHIERFIPERHRAGHAEHIRLFKETGITNRRMGALGAISGRRANGVEFPIEASISQVEVGGVTLATVILRDITEREAGEEARKLLAREVDHRAKNALAVVQALVSLTRAATTDQFITAVRGRVSALGRAHSLLAENRWEGADLAQVVTDECAAYAHDQISSRGPSVVLIPKAVQPIGLLLHELATNAVKYGALSTADGRVEIVWRVLQDGMLDLRWTETGGPAVARPTAIGFGTTLITEVATRQLGGALETFWPEGGFQLLARFPPSVYRAEPIAPPSEAPARPAAGAQPAVQRGRLLIVEDDTLIAMELCAALAAMGWEVVGPAGTVEEGRGLTDRGSLPDIAVLDVNLDGTLVYPLADHLRAEGVPFVFCSGYQRLEGHGDYEHVPLLHKPVDVTALDRELQRVMAAA